jgi:hypothetical protein
MCLLGMIFSLLLLAYNKGYKSANRFLAGVFFFSSLFFLTTFEFLFNKNIQIIAVFETVIPSFYFLICPFSYFYIRSIVKDNSKLSKYDFLHFLPFAIAFLGTMPLLLSSWENKLQIAENIRSNYWFNPNYRINVFLSPNQNKIFKGIQILVYVTLNWYTFYKYKLQLKHRVIHTRQYIIIRNWLIIFCAFLSLEAVFLIFGVYNVIVLQTKELFILRYYLYLTIMSLGFLLLNFSLLLIPQILYGLPIERLRNVNRIESASEVDDKPLHGVSLDKDKSSWIQAIQNDQLLWQHISDLKYWNSEVVPLYKIEGIPFNVLVDPKGMIVAKDLRGADLEQALAKFLK